MGDMVVSKSNRADGRVAILGFPLPDSNAAAISIVICGIFGCYCLSSISQEYVYATGFEFSTFLTFVAKATAACWGLVLAGRDGFSKPKCSHQQHFLIGFLSFTTMWLSNESLRYLAYPVQSIFKSAKLIPVMLSSTFILRKRHSAMEYLSALALFFGLICFTAGEMDVDPNFDWVGVLYISGALVCDALIGVVQEKMFKAGGTSTEMMILPNLYSACMSLVMTVAVGELVPAVKMVSTNVYALNAIAVYALLNILGIYFVLASIERFGAVTTTFVTTLRKAITVVLSFLLFSKPFDELYALGGALTVGGIALQMKAKSPKKQPALVVPTSMTTNGDDDSEDRSQLINIKTVTPPAGRRTPINRPVSPTPAA